MAQEKTNYMMPLIAIVAIVAIVGMVVMFMNMKTQTALSDQTAAENLAGQAKTIGCYYADPACCSEYGNDGLGWCTNIEVCKACGGIMVT
ncbi:hypothetical protein JW756_02255 [Candidatus Woesearchaeota archaeon]|nr:hypothetical protein [Candidatus Woesearchaeota archaeon]